MALKQRRHSLPGRRLFTMSGDAKQSVDPVEKAVALFEQDHACSQSLLLAYLPDSGIDRPAAFRIASPFAAGMGRFGGTCGAVVGALMVLGLEGGPESVDDEEATEQLYRRTREFISSFRERHGTILCRQLLGHDIGTPEGLEKARAEGVFGRRCPGFVRVAAEILGDLLKKY
jgi:C_GCAxxG_C_C family probable redox protein